MSSDLVDLLLQRPGQLPPALVEVALQQLTVEPERVEARLVELVKAIVEAWCARSPTLVEIDLAVALLEPHQRFMDEVEQKRSQLDGDDYMAANAPVVYLVTAFTKRTRAENDFTARFRLVNARLMPHVLRYFRMKP